MIRNDTICQNSSAQYGGGVGGCQAAIVNCILWGNTARGGPQQIHSCNNVSYCCVEGGGGGTGGIADDPHFADPDGADNNPETYQDNDYRLQANSPCFDRGLNEDWMWQAFDLDHNLRLWPRTSDWRVDMGAYEYGAPKPIMITSPTRSGSILAGDALRFAAYTSEGDGRVQYQWDLGDGMSSALKVPGLVAYNSPGEKVVKLNATLDQYQFTPTTRTITVAPDVGSVPDLAVMQLNVPASRAINQPAEISYSVRNIGDGILSGKSWKDAIYLSRDPYLDVNDLPLSSSPVSYNVAVGGSYTNSMPVTIPIVEEGAYCLLLSVDDEWQVLERHQLNNEFAVATDLVIPRLADGVPTFGRLAASGDALYYRIDLPTNTNLRVTLRNTGPGNRVQLYTRHGSLPTRGAYDYASGGSSGNSLQLVVPSAAPGVWYLLVYGEAVFAPDDFVLEATTAGLILADASPSYSGVAADVLLNLKGAGFDATTQVEFIATNGVPYPAFSISVVSYGEMTATVNSNSVPAGQYTVRVSQPDGDQADLPGVFEFLPGGSPDLQTRLILPSYLGYHMPATIYVEYSNAGTVAMPAPLLCLRSADPEGDERPLLTLDSTRAQNGFWSAVLPAGFAHSVQFLAGGVSPGWLNPGESGRVAVYYTGLQQPWNFGDRVFEFDLRVLNADDLTPIDWAGIKESLQPEWITTEAWEPVYANFVSQVGPVWGDYVRRLQENAKYLAQLGQNVLDVSKLWGFEVQKAVGLGPMRTIVNTLDLVVPATGISLGLDRVYRTSLDRRYVLGPFGRGWSTLWSASVKVGPDGSVLLMGYGGDLRRFEPDTRGGYLPPAGEDSVLTATAQGGFLLQEADGTVLTFLPSGKLGYLQDSNGNRVTAVYSGDRLIGLTHSGGQSLSITYNSFGRIERIDDPLGHSATYNYDASGEHLIAVRDFRNRTTRYSYLTGVELAKEHALQSIELPNGVREYYDYDSAGRMKSIHLNEGSPQVHFYYDGTGSVTGTNAMGATTRVFYDHTGAFARASDALGYSVLREFDSQHQAHRVTDSEGRSESYTFACCGLITSRTDPIGNVERFSYTVSPRRLASATDAAGNTTRYSYDSRGNLVTATYADHRRALFAYDARGNVIRLTDRNEQVFQYEYDESGRVVREQSPDGNHNSFVYDAKGNLLTASNSLGTIRMSYDENDRMTNITYPNGRSLSFEYDAAGRRVQMTDQLGFTIAYSYDALGRPHKASDGSGAVLAEYTYDELGRLARELHGNGTFTSWAYDPGGQVTRLVNHGPDGSVNSSFQYVYDNAGRITSVESPNGRWDYAYDALDQLVRAVFTSTNSEIPNQDLVYEYDPAGNRVRTIENGFATTYAVNNRNQYTAAGGETFWHDAEGNLVRQEGPTSSTQYTYDSRNRLVRVEAGGRVWEYEYDALGNRSAVIEDGHRTEFLVDPNGAGIVVAEYDGPEQLKARFVNGIRLLARVDTSGQLHYYDFDAQGSTCSLTDPAGTVVNQYAYRPFGEQLRSQQAVENPFCYVGAYGVMAEATGLLFVRARYYSPSIGRFCAEDPLGVSRTDLNPYRYALNSPVGNVDYTGMDYAGVYCDPAGGMRVPKPEYYWAYYGLSDPEKKCVDRHEAIHVRQCKEMGPTKTKEQCYKKEREAYEDSLWCVQNPEISKAFRREASAGFRRASRAAGLGLKNCDRLPPETPDPVSPPGDAGASGSAGGATAVDPNAKTGPGGFGAAGFLEPDRLYPYRVDFENEPSATAPAQQVVINDRLSPYLDWGRFEWTEVGWGDQWIAVPPGQRYFSTNVPVVTCCGAPFEVQVELGFSLESGEALAIFRSINPDSGLPPSVEVGFLPPEDGTGRGRGHISYVIRPKAGLPTGTEIRNVADISFDCQPSIATNQKDPHDPTQGTDPAKECLNTIDADPPTSVVLPLPPSSCSQFLVCWSGDDAGAGIGNYDIYVSDNGGEWTLWLAGTTETSGRFEGQVGHTYAFYSIACDSVGHIESVPPQADAATTTTVRLHVISVLYAEGAQLTWASSPGETYTVQSSTDLLTGTWNDVVTVPSQGQVTNWHDSDTASTRKFYRIEMR